MHKESLDIMKVFLDTLDKDKPLKILDVGSSKVQGQGKCYKDLLESDRWEYTGIDLVEGNNVDVITETPYDYPFKDKEFDVVISGQALEHVAYIWEWIKELNRVLKDGGQIFIIAPSRGHRHHRPDYWRIQPQGMEILLMYGGFGQIEVEIDTRSIWHDVWGKAIKMNK